MLPVEEVRLSPGQSGLMSGWGLFTTMRVIEGIPFAFERHWKRLTRDAEKTHCPFPFSQEAVYGQLNEVLRANQRTRRMRANLCDPKSGGILAQRRDNARRGFADLFG